MLHPVSHGGGQFGIEITRRASDAAIDFDIERGRKCMSHADGSDLKSFFSLAAEIDGVA